MTKNSGFYTTVSAFARIFGLAILAMAATMGTRVPTKPAVATRPNTLDAGLVVYYLGI